MTIGEWEKKLREKEREPLADMARTEADARGTGITETQSGAAAAESKESLLQETTSEWNVFTQVSRRFAAHQARHFWKMHRLWSPD